VTRGASGRGGNLRVILRRVPATSLPHRRVVAKAARTAPARTVCTTRTTRITGTACSRTRRSLQKSRTRVTSCRLPPLPGRARLGAI